jgi:hypothetical protein
LTDGQVEAFGVFGFDFVVDVFFCAFWWLFQDCGKRSAGVFGIDIDASSEDGLVADVGAGQVEAAFDF